MRKFTDEELSLVLGQHTGGLLTRAPLREQGAACLVRAAIAADNAYSGDLPMRLVDRAMTWFDTHYDPKWSADEFIARLEEQELA